MLALFLLPLLIIVALWMQRVYTFAILLTVGTVYLVVSQTSDSMEYMKQRDLVHFSVRYDAMECGMNKPIRVSIINDSDWFVLGAEFFVVGSKPGHVNILFSDHYKINKKALPHTTLTQCLDNPLIFSSEISPDQAKWHITEEDFIVRKEGN